jgi:hypothetical protein
MSCVRSKKRAILRVENRNEEKRESETGREISGWLPGWALRCNRDSRGGWDVGGGSAHQRIASRLDAMIEGRRMTVRRRHRAELTDWDF